MRRLEIELKGRKKSYKKKGFEGRAPFRRWTKGEPCCLNGDRITARHPSNTTGAPWTKDQIYGDGYLRAQGPFGAAHN